MSEKYKLKSGQINFESTSNAGAFVCVVIRNGVFHNLTEEQRVDLIHHLEQLAVKKVDLEDMI